jgi:hypothetical protein
VAAFSGSLSGTSLLGGSGTTAFGGGFLFGSGFFIFFLVNAFVAISGKSVGSAESHNEREADEGLFHNLLRIRVKDTGKIKRLKQD